MNFVGLSIQKCSFFNLLHYLYVVVRQRLRWWSKSAHDYVAGVRQYVVGECEAP